MRIIKNTRTGNYKSKDVIDKILLEERKRIQENERKSKDIL
ncbi:hypothetical protein [Methanobacterium sp.]